VAVKVSIYSQVENKLKEIIYIKKSNINYYWEIAPCGFHVWKPSCYTNFNLGNGWSGQRNDP